MTLRARVENGLTLSSASWRVWSQKEANWLEKRKFQSLQSSNTKTTQTRTGNPNLQMLGQVSAMLLPMLDSPNLNDLGFRWNKPTDIVSTLVNIYDSRELFIRELSQLFSHRLMDIRDGNLEGVVSSVSCTVIYCLIPASPETSY